MEMARLVLEALEREERVLVEAGTGIGKTFAYLIPAILTGKKVVLSTGTRQLQDQIFHKDLPALSALFPPGFQAVLMKGRENYLCLSRFREFRANPTFFRREEIPLLDRIAAWAEKTERGDRAELEGFPDETPLWKEISATAAQCPGKSCESYDNCFITRMKRQMEESRLIIVNHHLYFADLALRESYFGEVLPEHDAVIFDEAHLIEDVASEYFGITFAAFQIMELAGDARRELKAINLRDQSVWENLDKLVRRGEDFLNVFVPSGLSEKRFRTPPPDSLARSVGRIQPFLNILSWMESSFLTLPEKTEGCTRISERALKLKLVCENLIRQEDEDQVYWGELTPSVQLRTTPVSVSKILSSAIFSTRKAMVFTSATLTVEGRFDYLKKRTGIVAEKEVQLLSPFDYASNCLVYLPLSIPEPSSEKFPLAAAEEIVRILEQTSGRAFVLCTSHKNKDFFQQYCRERLSYLCLKQGDGSRMELLKRFREEVSSVLFATQGFWQGIDVQGEALSCVILDKLPFSSPSDPVMEARIRALKREQRDPFLEYQLPSAVTMMKQGLGRLIRSERDRGVLSILDARLRTKGYGKIFMASLPACRVTSDLEDVGNFFKKESVSGGMTSGELS